MCPEVRGLSWELGSVGASSSSKEAWQLWLDTASRDWKPYLTHRDDVYSPNSLLPCNHGLLGFPESPTKIQRKRHFVTTGDFIIIRKSRRESSVMSQALEPGG